MTENKQKVDSNKKTNTNTRLTIVIPENLKKTAENYIKSCGLYMSFSEFVRTGIINELYRMMEIEQNKLEKIDMKGFTVE